MNIQLDITQLCKEVLALSPRLKIKHVGEIFLDPSYEDLLSLPIVESGIPVGLVNRYQIMNIYIMQYGRELYGNSPVSSIMNAHPLILDINMELESASEYITKNMRFPITEDFIIARDGMYQGVGTVTDILKAITDLKFRAYDKALREKVEQLKQRNIELAIKTEEAKSANKIKSQFLATMSHELRTPLNAILGYIEILQEDFEESENDSVLPDLQKIHQASTHLLHIINDVLDISKIEAGKMELNLTQFEIKPLLSVVDKMIKPHLAINHNDLNIEISPIIFDMTADMQKLKQILLNLLNNAAKFSENSEISLKITPFIKNNESWLIFSVKDQGIGMSSEQLDKIFQPFIQIDTSYTRKYDGTGLGLTIVKQFTEMMGGYIDVTSQPNQGSVFSVYLPHVVQVSNKRAKKNNKPLTYNNESQQQNLC